MSEDKAKKAEEAAKREEERLLRAINRSSGSGRTLRSKKPKTQATTTTLPKKAKKEESKTTAPSKAAATPKTPSSTPFGSIEAVYAQFEEFKTAMAEAEVEECSKLLSQLKISMLPFGFLVPSGVDITEAQKKSCFIGRAILEQAVFLSVRRKDMAGFERHLSQVQSYYLDSSALSGGLPKSQNKLPILGLNLLRLLALNQIADFHTELELIPSDEQNSVYIKFPVDLEQYIMEGNYNKVFKAAADVPHESYKYFIDMLINTRLRDEIAECSEEAYKLLSVEDALRMLRFSDEAELKSYAEERGWTLEGSNIIFRKHNAEKESIPSMLVIARMLNYAKELERIV